MTTPPTLCDDVDRHEKPLACSRYRYSLPGLFTDDAVKCACVMFMRDRGHSLGLTMVGVERERRTKYMRAIGALVKDIPDTARGCDVNFLIGLSEGLRSLNFREESSAPLANENVVDGGK